MAGLKQFTRQQISEGCGGGEAVFIIDNVVYDVSQFLDEHPGGHEVLVHARGKDASEDFDDVGHSFDAKELMKKYVVGELVVEDRVQLKKRHVSWEETSPAGDASFLTSWKFPLLMGVLVTALYTYLVG